MLFLIKTIISHFLHPAPILATLFVGGLVMRRFGNNRWKRLGSGLLVAGFALFLTFGFGAFNPVLKRLEMTSPPFDGADVALCESLRGATVTVLGQGLDDEDVPERFCDNDGLRRRISEGAYVAHCIPESRLLVSMSGGAPSERKVKAIGQFIKNYGLDPERVDFYEGARDTREEALATLRLAGTNNVVLVTSSSHMPRSLIIFRKYGFDPVPAPCDYRYFGDGTRWNLRELHLSPLNFTRADRVIHESAGLLFEKIRR